MTASIQYRILEQEDGYLNVEITIPSDWIVESQKVVLNKFKAKGDLPELNILQDAVYQHAMRQGVKQFLEEFPRVPWEEPTLNFIANHPEKGLVFTTQMEILPEVELRDYAQIAIEMPPVALPTEELVLTEIYDLWYSLAETIPVDRPVQSGDRLVVDMIAVVDDKPIPTSARADYTLDIEENTLFPGFTEQLIGLSAGDSQDVVVILPEDYSVPAWRNQEALYSVYIHEVYELKRPPLDDTFPQLIGKGNTTEEMTQQIYDELVQENQSMWVEAVRECVVNTLVSKTPITVPDTLLEAEQTSVWERTDGVALKKQGLPTDFIDHAYDVWMEQEGIRLECYWNLKVALVLRAIAQKEHIQMSEAELNAELQVLSAPFGSDPEEIYTELQKTGKLTDVASKLLLCKTVDFLLTKTTLTCNGETISLADGTVLATV